MITVSSILFYSFDQRPHMSKRIIVRVNSIGCQPELGREVHGPKPVGRSDSDLDRKILFRIDSDQNVPDIVPENTEKLKYGTDSDRSSLKTNLWLDA